MSGPVVPASPLLQLPIRQAIWSLARPTIALGVLRSSYFLANAFWISKMGEKGLAAIGGCAFATWITYSLMDIAATGVYSQVAPGEGRPARGAGQRRPASVRFRRPLKVYQAAVSTVPTPSQRKKAMIATQGERL